MSGPVEPDHQGHLQALIDGDVEFVLIGGLAVAALGAPRATLDTDIVAAPDLSNLERLSVVLRELDSGVPGLPPDFDDPTSARILSSGPNVRFETRLGQLHIVQSPAGAPPYPDLVAEALEVKLEPDLTVKVCSYEHLVAMKTASDRDQDRLDLQRLREARG